jgi:molybdopterin-dependent oxidoreductase alpha subunit
LTRSSSLRQIFIIFGQQTLSSMRPKGVSKSFKQKKNTPTMAVGWPGVWAAGQHVFGAMPVGRGLKALLNLNQMGKVDCPSCAWPDPDTGRSKLGEYCENGAKAIAEEATTRKIGAAFFQRYSVAEMAQKSDFWLGQQGRLSHPMVLRPGTTHYEPIAWQEAFALVAENLNQLSSPDQAVFYTSGRSSNEAAFLYQLFVKAFGTNNLPDCSNMCHESSGVALSETLGLGKGSVTLEDFEKAEVIIIMGQNPGTNHPRMLSSLEKAKANGAQVVAINPLFETGLLGFKNPQSLSGMLGSGTALADLYLQVKINGDLPLLKAILACLWQKEKQQPGQVFDLPFIATHTQNFETFTKQFEELNTEELLRAAGIPMPQAMALVELLAAKSRIIVCWAMGLTQHKNAVATIKEVVNLLLVKGAIGKPGAGTCPVRGHSNVQGDRSVGIIHKPSPALSAAIHKEFGFLPPTQQGYDVVEAIGAMHAGHAKVFVALGGNFYSASPDSGFTAEALNRCKLSVQISTKLNRSHLVTGQTALILPCLGRTDIDYQAAGEQFVSTENSMGVVQKSQGVLVPVADTLRSEPSIVAHLAFATLGSRLAIPWLAFAADYSLIRKAIANTVEGFEHYENRLKNEGGFYLPNPPREGRFKTPSGKALFSVNHWHKIELKPHEFLMMTIRSHDQFNTTIYGLNDRYRGVYNERRIIFIHPEDMKSRGFQEYEQVDIVSHYGQQRRVAEGFALVPYNIPLGCLATYFPEANVLVPLEEVADFSQTPISKSVVVRLEKRG